MHVVGQSALEKKAILLTNVPDDYIQISSGLGEATPLNVLVFPVLFEDEVKAVEAAYSPPYWVHVLIAIPVIIFLPLLLLRPVKGVLLCQQWKTKAEEGRLNS